MFTYFADRSLIPVFAVIVDYLIGEPQRFHPLVGFGNIASSLDYLLFENNFCKNSIFLQRAIGVIGVTTTIVPLLVITHFLAAKLGMVADVLFLYLAIGAKSLAQHSKAVMEALNDGDLQLARQRVGMIVSRNTDNLDSEDISRATIESILENGSDAIFGAIFWFAILGPTGAVLFRLANTLDAMWGYKTERYLHFGWAAARLDDLLGLVPARLTALSYAIVGNTRNALKCWRYQAKSWYSPNAGPVMASGAGALSLQLGGAATYNNVVKERPNLGLGNAPTPADIDRAIKLVRNALLLWVVVMALGGLVTKC